ncbi:uncharacterized protein LOC121835443 [Ixodes scapularis]|uniref:uncharacterized protein LOC121835443 n=1 Tax=Ixodes scapularis TaxID=6945 RepID=UPI001C38B563|nr:uncharacterized protein LOC121835443 [Ixodes scapularis]
MFRFPWNEARKLRWAVAVKRATQRGDLWQPSVGARLCEAHFVTGSPNTDPNHVDYIPSLFSYDAQTMQHSEKKTKRCPILGVEVQTEPISARCTNCSNLMEETKTLKAEVASLKNKLEALRDRQTLNKDVTAMRDDVVLFYAGITKVLFMVILSTLTPLMPAARNGFPLGAQLLMFLMKLRHNMAFQDLAYRFEVSPRTASRTFRAWLEAMAQLCRGLIVFPRPEVARSWLTLKEREHFSKLRAVIDCTEVSVSRPLNLDTQQVVWSSYKQNSTLKYLVAVNPHGAVVFVSRACGGRVSDKELTIASGFMDLLEAGDQVLADRGFLLHEEFFERNVQLITPRFRTNRLQLTVQEVTNSRRISSSRIIVERSIGHFKKWKIMTGTVPHTLVNFYDEINVVVAGLTNLSPTLVKNGKNNQKQNITVLRI